MLDDATHIINTTIFKDYKKFTPFKNKEGISEEYGFITFEIISRSLLAIMIFKSMFQKTFQS